MTDQNNGSETNAAPSIKSTDEQHNAFTKTLKIGYYLIFYREGLINGDQLACLMAIQEKSKVHTAP